MVSKKNSLDDKRLYLELVVEGQRAKDGTASLALHSELLIE
jgi:hypothetical protein